MSSLYERLQAMEFAKEHPEFADYDPPRLPNGESAVNDPPVSERMGGQRVLTGYEQLPIDRFTPVPPDESRTRPQRVVLAKIERAMAQLPEKRQDILRRAYWERQTQAEIGADLGISQQAVASRLRTAERHLRRVYSDAPIGEDEL